MQTLLAFLAALALLIAVHEYGHYRMAVACGVRVLRYAIGFGPTLLRYQRHPDGTEFVLGAIPLGGYVRMLDEREGPVDPAERHRAFNQRPLRDRVFIVAAGPIANLVLAVLLYTVVNWTGIELAAPVLAPPPPGSLAARAGFEAGERVLRAALEGSEFEPVRSIDDLRWVLTQGITRQRNVTVVVAPSHGHGERERTLVLSGLESHEADGPTFERVGLGLPLTRPEIGAMTPDGAARRAGLQQGDLVLRSDDVAVVDGRQLRELIRGSLRNGQPQPLHWQIERNGQVLALDVAPQRVEEAAGPVARIGAYVGAAPEMVRVRYGLIDALWQGTQRTWDVSALTVRTLGRMLVGEASLRNLTGPLTIADYAGRSAALGLDAYLVFLALVSVSLGVLNLMPLPMLDGGHLMYYLWEGATGRPVTEVWLERLQRAGLVVLMLMMSVALFNDLNRLLG